MDRPLEGPSSMTSDASGPQARCRACHRPLEASATFCSHCGIRQTRFDTWAYHPFWILVLGFLVLGPFALVLVWLSRKMRPTAKVVVSVVLLIYTAVVVYYTYETVAPLMQEFQEIRQIEKRL